MVHFFCRLVLTSIPIIALSSAASAVENTLPISHGDSWAALAIVITAVLTALFMNYRAPKVRAFGTLLAALGCFAVVVWFANILSTGVLENPKPNQAPLDSAKPALLWIQTAIAFISGWALVLVAYKQSKNTVVLELHASNEPVRYGRVSRLLHWVTAILIISLIPIGIFTTMIPEDAWFRNHYYVVHKTIGMIVFGLLVIRLLWNRKSKRPELDETLKPAEKRWAHRVHIALYVMMMMMPITGYVMTTYHGYPTYFFIWEVPPLWGEGQAYLVWGTFHKYILPYLLYIILGAHILGALKHQFVDKHDSAFKRMVG
ncbi:MAG: cytochrome b561 [Pseudomonadales bacterium]|jgi:cytochrome b561